MIETSTIGGLISRYLQFLLFCSEPCVGVEAKMTTV